jgi:hypothetical protein
MKRYTHFFLAMALLLSSCSRHYYAPALFNNDISYLPKPASFDTAKSAVYISGGAGFGQGADVNHDGIGFGSIEASAAHTFKGANLAYGVFGFAGSITNGNSGDDNDNTYYTGKPGNYAYQGSKGVYGAGARLSGNLYSKIDNVDFRFLGFEAVYSKEFGNYARYRKLVSGVDDYYAYTQTRLLTVGLTSEALWHGAYNKDRQYALRGFLGRTFGHYNRKAGPYDDGVTLQSVYLAASFYMQIKRFFYITELSATPGSLYVIPEFRMKFGYKF